MPEIVRDVVARVLERLVRPPPLIQILVGARQVGKTTAARQVEGRAAAGHHNEERRISPDH